MAITVASVASEKSTNLEVLPRWSEQSVSTLWSEAISESLKPVRPGIPGGNPFWNGKARRFIYAPAFDFKPVEGAAYYRFTAIAEGSELTFVSETPTTTLTPIWNNLPLGEVELRVEALADSGKRIRGKEGVQQRRFMKKKGMSAPFFDFNHAMEASSYRFRAIPLKRFVFEAEHPWAPLTPIWKDLPVGNIRLTVEGLKSKGGERIRLARIGHKKERKFYRASPFRGPYYEPPAAEYDESVRWSYETLFKMFQKRCGPRGRCEIGAYPSKFASAFISGMTAYAQLLSSKSVKAKEAMQIARAAAKTLMDMSMPADSPLEFFPPTYKDKKRFNNQIMLVYPAVAGNAYLDLYEATKDAEFLEAARRIADTYKKTQLKTGSWPLTASEETGDPGTRNLCMPVGIIEFLERLEKSHGMMQYNQTRLAAFRYLMEEVVMPFRVDAQFEDQSTKAPPYHNLSAIPAMQIAMYLFEHREEDSAYTALAEELLHFAEDQFVIWERPINKKFFTPCALEQYSYYTPVIGAAAMFMKATSKAFEETQKELYKAKALSLANAFVVLQETAQGQFPTFCNKGGKVGGWPNVGTYTTSALQYVAEGLKKK